MGFTGGSSKHREQDSEAEGARQRERLTSFSIPLSSGHDGGVGLLL